MRTPLLLILLAGSALATAPSAGADQPFVDVEPYYFTPECGSCVGFVVTVHDPMPLVCADCPGYRGEAHVVTTPAHSWVSAEGCRTGFVTVCSNAGAGVRDGEPYVVLLP